MSRIATLAKTNRKEFKRFSKFLVVGITGFIVDFGVFNLLIGAVGIQAVSIFGIVIKGAVIAQAISFSLAAINNFTWNRYWTYPESRSRALHHQLGMFFLVNVAGVAIRIPILRFVEPVILNWLNASALDLPVTTEFLARNITLAIAVGIVMLWNFFVNRYWTYNDVD